MEDKNIITELPRKLYLRLTPTSLCFARYELRDEPVFAFSEYRVRPQTSLSVNLRDAMQTEKLLSAPAIVTHVMVGGPVTLVPLADFQEEDCATIYDYLFPNDQPHKVFYDTIPSASAVLLFSLEEQICQTLESLFDGVDYHSTFTPLLRHFAKKTMASGCAQKIFVYGHEQGVDIAAYDGNRLIMVNTFPASNPVDVAYYVFNIARSLSGDFSQLAFYISGNEHRRDLISSEIQKYATEVFVLHPTAEFNRHVVSVSDDVPYDMMTLLAE